jgi:signal peptidase I
VDTTVRTLLELLVITIFAITFLVQPAAIPSGSMEPTLRVGELMLTDKQSFAPEGLWRWLLPPTGVRRGDLTVFHFPPQPETLLVKRVIGLPGDHLRLQDGRVILNGAVLDEPYASYLPTQMVPYRDDFPFLRSLDPNVEPAWWAFLRSGVKDGEVTVPAGEYFVLGDNRNASEDSRYWGFVRDDQMIGRPLVVTVGRGGGGNFRVLR